MNNKELELAQELERHDDWVWSTGIVTDEGDLVDDGQIVEYDLMAHKLYQEKSYTPRDPDGELPDLTHPATRGVVLAEIQKKWPTAWLFVLASRAGKPTSYAMDDHSDRGLDIVGDTEGEVLGRAWLESRG